MPNGSNGVVFHQPVPEGREEEKKETTYNLGLAGAQLPEPAQQKPKKEKQKQKERKKHRHRGIRHPERGPVIDRRAEERNGGWDRCPHQQACEGNGAGHQDDGREYKDFPEGAVPSGQGFP